MHSLGDCILQFFHSLERHAGNRSMHSSYLLTYLTLSHSEWPKLNGVLAILNAVGLIMVIDIPGACSYLDQTFSRCRLS